MADRRPQNAVEGSYPAGNGGRVKFPRYRSQDDLFEDTDPAYGIYSGMTKRLAISDGSFSPNIQGKLPPDIPRD